MKKCDLVFHYHDQTKHDYYRYASSLGHLDWDNQPDPFRRFIGSRLIIFTINRSSSFIGI